MLLKIALKLIDIYQKTVSPNHGSVQTPFLSGGCKFYPSCSEFLKNQLLKNGLTLGLILGFWRILRCNPLSHGGYDPA